MKGRNLKCSAAWFSVRASPQILVTRPCTVWVPAVHGGMDLLRSQLEDLSASVLCVQQKSNEIVFLFWCYKENVVKWWRMGNQKKKIYLTSRVYLVLTSLNFDKNKQKLYSFNVLKKSSCDHRESWNSLRITWRSIFTSFLHPLLLYSSKESGNSPSEWALKTSKCI